MCSGRSRRSNATENGFRRTKSDRVNPPNATVVVNFIGLKVSSTYGRGKDRFTY